jgi:hypothetical protein
MSAAIRVWLRPLPRQTDDPAERPPIVTIFEARDEISAIVAAVGHFIVQQWRRWRVCPCGCGRRFIPKGKQKFREPTCENRARGRRRRDEERQKREEVYEPRKERQNVPEFDAKKDRIIRSVSGRTFPQRPTVNHDTSEAQRWVTSPVADRRSTTAPRATPFGVRVTQRAIVVVRCLARNPTYWSCTGNSCQSLPSRRTASW